ncbi:hypothetical protein [Halomontanus rarus]|uniref:hypothetical protein n=1 Tax=Halomontanus rarus TaxID=3034020 RepID=UPI001A990894
MSGIGECDVTLWRYRIVVPVETACHGFDHIAVLMDMVVIVVCGDISDWVLSVIKVERTAPTNSIKPVVLGWRGIDLAGFGFGKLGSGVVEFVEVGKQVAVGCDWESPICDWIPVLNSHY